MFWETSYGRAARHEGWKWLDAKQGGGLPDLDHDIGESHDLASERPELRAEMQARWSDWKKEVDASKRRGPLEDY